MVSAAVMGPARWDWLKSVRTRSPFLKRETREPVATMVPAPSEAGMMGKEIGKGYLPWRDQWARSCRGKIGLIWYHGDNEISVIQRSIVEIDENVVVTECWDVSFVVKLKAVEAVLALDSPLLGG